jgi:OmpA-OmpF porin, OOP family
MVKNLLICSLLAFSSTLYAQDIRWADRVIDVSSQLGSTENSALNILGAPDAMQQGEGSPNAWSPAVDEDGQFIHVAFREPIRVRQVVIAESANPGAVEFVTLYDAEGRELISTRSNIQPVQERSRILSIPVAMTPRAVASVKITLAAGRVEGRQAIDAIGISGSEEPYREQVNIAEDINFAQAPDRLGAGVNSPYNEFGPIVSADGKTLYFSRRFHPKNVGGKRDMEDIWFSTWDEQSKAWSEARNMGEPMNNDLYNFVSSVTPDGNTLLLGNVYNRDGSMDAGVSITRRTENGWTFPEKLNIINERNVNKKVNYALSNSGNILITSAERPGDTRGDRDLYVSFLQEDGRWSEPKSLGPVVNTNKADYAPFLAADNRTLYYSTSGHTGFGGDDIFMTRRMGEGWDNWTTPENLGDKINTPKDDAYFTLPASGEWAYYTSNSASGKDQDIYRINMPPAQRPRPVVLVRGRVLNQDSNDPISASIVYQDLATGKEIGRATTSPVDGMFQIVLPSGVNYGYMAKSQGFIAVSDNMDLKELNEYKEIEKDLLMSPISAERKTEVVMTPDGEEKVEEVVAERKPIRMNNIFFDFNKATLRPESLPELDRFVEVMKENEGLSIEVAGHTDDVGSAEYNQRLSKERAKAVEKYLESQGVPAKRVSSVGYGKAKPVAPNTTDEGRSQNRRVEFIIKD